MNESLSLRAPLPIKLSVWLMCAGAVGSIVFLVVWSGTVLSEAHQATSQVFNGTVGTVGNDITSVWLMFPAVGFPLWFLLAGVNYAGWRRARLCAAGLFVCYTADAILLTALGTLTVGLADCQSGPETDSCMILPDSPYVDVPAPFAGKVVLWVIWLIGLAVIILLSLPASSRYVAVKRWLRRGSPRGR